MVRVTLDVGTCNRLRGGMTNDPVDDLPLVQRLALAYAPAAARDDTLALLMLDNRLASILRQRSETIIPQIKLAWWRDRLSEDRSAWPLGEPLLGRLAKWRGDTRYLVAMVDGWETMLAERFDRPQMEEFAQGRSAAWAALSTGLGQNAHNPDVERAAREWALTDLAMNLEQDEERATVNALAKAQSWQAPRIARALRPLAVLHGLARRAMKRGSADLLDGPGASLVALRIGATGR